MHPSLRFISASSLSIQFQHYNYIIDIFLVLTGKAKENFRALLYSFGLASRGGRAKLETFGTWFLAFTEPFYFNYNFPLLNSHIQRLYKQPWFWKALTLDWFRRGINRRDKIMMGHIVIDYTLPFRVLGLEGEPPYNYLKFFPDYIIVLKEPSCYWCNRKCFFVARRCRCDVSATARGRTINRPLLITGRKRTGSGDEVGLDRPLPSPPCRFMRRSHS